MILFPHAKINLGLHCLNKREDGFHEIESYLLPVPIFDILEITPSKRFEYFHTGIPIEDKSQKSLCEKAYDLMNRRFKIDPLRIHLRKQIPIGAGLGGGSSDASFTLKGIQELFNLNLSTKQMMELAAELGSDCPFFIKDHGAMIYGRGEQVVDFTIDIKGIYIVVCDPKIHISTKMAFQGIIPKIPPLDLKSCLQMPRTSWLQNIKNDFEENICKQYPTISEGIQLLYSQGALIASLSGSGSSYFGLFEDISALNLDRFSSSILYFGPLDTVNFGIK